jgi:hypothetical protein
VAVPTVRRSARLIAPLALGALLLGALAPGAQAIVARVTVASTRPAHVDDAAESPPTPSNVALGQPAEQSSTDYGGTPDRAVDGDTNGDFMVGSVTHTSNGMGEWWQVDLGESFDIGEIVIWNRTDCCAERLHDVLVLVSDDPFPPTAVSEPTGWSSVIQGVADQETAIPVGVRGRYVRVQQTGAEYLSLAEVEVWSPVRPAPSPTPTPTPSPTPLVSAAPGLSTAPPPSPSAGPAVRMVDVPSLRGLTEQAALEELRAAGLVPGARSEDFDLIGSGALVVPAGSIVESSPPAGASVPVGSTVDYVVSRGAPPSGTAGAWTLVAGSPRNEITKNSANPSWTDTFGGGAGNASISISVQAPDPRDPPAIRGSSFTWTQPPATLRPGDRTTMSLAIAELANNGIGFYASGLLARFTQPGQPCGIVRDGDIDVGVVSLGSLIGTPPSGEFAVPVPATGFSGPATSQRMQLQVCADIMPSRSSFYYEYEWKEVPATAP